jgi:hypothetical protein
MKATDMITVLLLCIVASLAAHILFEEFWDRMIFCMICGWFIGRRVIKSEEE